MVKQNVSGLQWIATWHWAALLTVLQSPHFVHLVPYLRGTLGVAVHRGEIPGLKDFLLKIHPGNEPDNSHESTIVSLMFNFVFNTWM